MEAGRQIGAAHVTCSPLRGLLRSPEAGSIVINQSRKRLEDKPSPRAQLRGAFDHAEKTGYSPDLFKLEDLPFSAKRLGGILRTRGVDGVVFIATVDPELPREVLELGQDFACAIAGVRYSEIPFHVFLKDFLSVGRTNVLNIVEAGFQWPAILLPRGLDQPLGYGFTGGVWTGLMDVPVENRLSILHLGNTE